MNREVLLFWRQANASVLLFAAGREMVQGERLNMKVGGPTQPLLKYEVVAVYTAEAVQLVADYCAVWEPVLPPAHIVEMRAGIQRVRNAPTAKAYLLRVTGVVEVPQPEAPKKTNFNPVMN